MTTDKRVDQIYMQKYPWLKPEDMKHYYDTFNYQWYVLMFQLKDAWNTLKKELKEIWQK